MGVVEEAGDHLISLNNGVDCYLIPEALDPADVSRLEPALGALHPGDVVGMTGMLCDTDPFTLKYCGLPYLYYDGSKFYTEYEGFRKNGTYPEIAFNEETFRYFTGLVNRGNVPYQTVSDVWDAFKAGGDVTADSFAQGADIYRDTVLGLSGRVTGVGPNYINIEGIYCFYHIDFLMDFEKRIIDSITVNDYVTLKGLVSNPSLDAFRLNYCTFEDRIPAEQRYAAESGSSEAGAVSEVLYRVLLGEEQFLNYGYGDIEEYSFCDAVSDGAAMYETLTFSIIDMNQDGRNEVVLYSGSANGVYTVLYEYNGKAYGAFLGSGREAAQEECEDYLAQIGWNGDGSTQAQFADYTKENILALLTAQ